MIVRSESDTDSNLHLCAVQYCLCVWKQTWRKHKICVHFPPDVLILWQKVCRFRFSKVKLSLLYIQLVSTSFRFWVFRRLFQWFSACFPIRKPPFCDSDNWICACLMHMVSVTHIPRYALRAVSMQCRSYESMSVWLSNKSLILCCLRILKNFTAKILNNLLYFERDFINILHYFNLNFQPKLYLFQLGVFFTFNFYWIGDLKGHSTAIS